jgi:hypothetical protein
MLNIQKQQDTPIAVIRAASGYELTEYEKKKLANIEAGAQQNTIEAIRVNGVKAPIDYETKTALIDLNLKNLAFKNTINSDDIDPDALFFIKCEL